MTDVGAALSILACMNAPEREKALADFYGKWKSDPLVLDKWFTVQATSTLPDAAKHVAALTKHPDFGLKNPNRVRSLVGAFAMADQARFHGKDGAGYTFLADQVIALDALNPQVAARMAGAFDRSGVADRAARPS